MYLTNNETTCEKIKNSFCLVTNWEKECIACDKGIEINWNVCDPENKISIEHCEIFTGS